MGPPLPTRINAHGHDTEPSVIALARQVDKAIRARGAA
jgi:hypothetical protein